MFYIDCDRKRWRGFTYRLQVSVRDGIAYDEAWDETAELLISDKVKKSEIGKGKIKSSEVGGSKVESSEVVESETEEIEMEESDHFEDLKVTNFNYEHPPTTSFYHLYKYIPR